MYHAVPALVRAWYYSHTKQVFLVPCYGKLSIMLLSIPN